MIIFLLVLVFYITPALGLLLLTRSQIKGLSNGQITERVTFMFVPFFNIFLLLAISLESLETGLIAMRDRE